MEEIKNYITDKFYDVKDRVTAEFIASSIRIDPFPTEFNRAGFADTTYEFLRKVRHEAKKNAR